MSTLGNFVWSIADQLRGVYKPHQYGGVILPFTILRRQARVNTARQFAESPDFDEAVTDAVADNRDAYTRLADFFFSDAPGRASLILQLANVFHEFAKDAQPAA